MTLPKPLDNLAEGEQQVLIALLRQSLKHSRPERNHCREKNREMKRAAKVFPNLESLVSCVFRLRPFL